jgi:methylthioribose-1-phosphate isomerase
MAEVAISGADRVCANGDVVNKVGTYPLALLCHEHGVPFYAVAPTSTVDAGTARGADVVIEERDPREVTTFAPEGTEGWNPAFDVTPARLVTAVITEHGPLHAPAAADGVPHSDLSGNDLSGNDLSGKARA